jgi:ammonia channel protein AmtB
MLSFEVDNTNSFNNFYLYNGPTSLLLGMSASLLGAFCISSLMNGGMIIRDIVHAPVSGAIVVGSSSAFISSPVYALVAGLTAGIVQTLIQNLIEKPHQQ